MYSFSHSLTLSLSLTHVFRGSVEKGDKSVCTNLWARAARAAWARAPERARPQCVCGGLGLPPSHRPPSLNGRTAAAQMVMATLRRGPCLPPRVAHGTRFCAQKRFGATCRHDDGISSLRRLNQRGLLAPWTECDRGRGMPRWQ